MTLLDDRELKRHELLAAGLLALGLIVWLAAGWLRVRAAWVFEYPHAMMAMAVVLVFSSLTWRLLAFGQAFWRRNLRDAAVRRMLVYLAGYTVCIVIGFVWMLIEKRRIPDLAWGRNRADSVLVLYTVLVILLPWALTVTARSLSGTPLGNAQRSIRPGDDAAVKQPVNDQAHRRR